MITQLQLELKSSQQQCHSLDLSLKRFESQLSSKDKIIHELQLSMNEIERQKMLDEKKRDAHSSRALEIATETIQQLQVSQLLVLERHILVVTVNTEGRTSGKVSSSSSGEQTRVANVS